MQCFAHARERERVYLLAAAEVGFHPDWDRNMEFAHSQDDRTIEEWYAVQEKIVKHCLKQTDASLLPYVGTAVTTRDLAAMADAFDGPGSMINFWGMGLGSLIGSYLLESKHFSCLHGASMSEC